MLLGAAIYERQKAQRFRVSLESTEWAVQKHETLDKLLSISIWAFSGSAWVVFLIGIVWGAWPDPLSVGILAGISLAFFLIRQQTSRS
jgi:hypothetical protein